MLALGFMCVWCLGLITPNGIAFKIGILIFRKFPFISIIRLYIQMSTFNLIFDVQKSAMNFLD